MLQDLERKAAELQRKEQELQRMQFGGIATKTCNLQLYNLLVHTTHSWQETIHVLYIVCLHLHVVLTNCLSSDNVQLKLARVRLNLNFGRTFISN